MKNYLKWMVKKLISFDEKNLYMFDFVREIGYILGNEKIKKPSWSKERIENYINLLKLGYREGEIIIHIDEFGQKNIIYGKERCEIIKYFNSIFLFEKESMNIIIKFYELRGKRIEKINFLELYNNVNEKGKTYDELLEIVYGGDQKFIILKKIFLLLKKIVKDITILELLEIYSNFDESSYLNIDNRSYKKKFFSKKDRVLNFLEESSLNFNNNSLNNYFEVTLKVISQQLEDFRIFNKNNLEDKIKVLEQFILNRNDLYFAQCSCESFEKNFIQQMKINEEQGRIRW